MKIVVLDAATVINHNDISLQALESLGEVTVYPYTSPDQLIERLAGAEAAITNKCLFTREVFEACPSLKYLGLFATGYNNIDIAAAKDHGVTVSNAGSYSTNAVAQHVFAMILHFYSAVAPFNDTVQAGDWKTCEGFSYFLPNLFPEELAGKTLGIYGFGSIGKAVAKIAEAFSMKILVHTRTLPKQEDFPNIEFADSDTLFSQSDIITLHCPLTPETTALINAENISLMKPAALLINTARGGCVDENALASALKEGRIKGAAIDVLSKEPMSAECPLFKAPNCLITPHVAWAPKATRERLMAIVAGCLEGYINGSPMNIIV